MGVAIEAQHVTRVGTWPYHLHPHVLSKHEVGSFNSMWQPGLASSHKSAVPSFVSTSLNLHPCRECQQLLFLGAPLGIFPNQAIIFFHYARVHHLPPVR